MKPCERYCKDRSATCHVSCEKYIAFRKKLDELKAKNRRGMPIHIVNKT